MLPSLAVRLTLHTGVLLLAGGLLLVLAVATAIYRRDRIGTLLIVVHLVGTVWCLTVVFQLSTDAAAEMLVWYKLRSSAVTFTALFTFLFVAAYTNREAWFRRRVLGAVSVLPLVVNVVLWSGGMHPLLFADWAVVRVGGLTAISQTPGPLAILSGAYNSLLVIVAVAYLSAEMGRSTRLRTYRIQAGLLLFGITVPLLTNVLYSVGVTGIDYTPVAIAVFAVLAMVAVFRFRLLDLIPIARDVVMENMDTGAVVVDADGTITDLNPPWPGNTRR